MKLNFKQSIAFLLATVAGLCACKGAPKFSDVSGKEWLLVEIRTQSGNITFDRKNLDSEGFGNIFSLNFDAERLSGIGAPNRYSAPYTVEKGQVIAVKLIAGTMMAAIHEPEKLKEHDYFNYLQNTTRWNLINGRLELYTKGENGEEATLVFSLGG